MRWLMRTVLALALLLALVLGVGASLPREHTAAVRFDLRDPPQAVYAAIADVAPSADLREDLERVEVLAGDPLRWRETAGWGTLTFLRKAADPPRRIVNRIEDTGEPFGGTWTFQLVPAGEGTTVTITEEGWVSNPIYRLLSRYFFGHYTVLEAYARDLGRRFGQDVRVARVT